MSPFTPIAPRPLRISQVGLRGVVGPGLTAAHAMEFSLAFGTFLEPGGSVAVGRDHRMSGIMIGQGVIAALLACGHEVIDLGVVSTPIVQHAILRLGASGGISIGASHNDAGWNALKFLGRGGSYLSTAEASELLDIYHLKKFRFAAHDSLGRLRRVGDAIDRYLENLESFYDFPALRRFRVVVDCCNGTSAPILQRLNERFGFSFILINEKVDGVHLAHEPNTNSSTLDLQLAPLVRPLGANAGFLFDTDSDRIATATEEGAPVSEETILPMLADHLLPRGPGKLVITNLSSTALLEEVAGWHGGKVVRVAVGRQSAMDALASYPPEQIALAGEGTGAVMMPQFRFVYDGIAAMLSILTMMAERGRKLSGIVAGYPRYSILKGQVPLVSTRVPALLTELEQAYPDGVANRTDGLRMDWPERWFHARVSQTEPVLRVICEQRGEPPAALFESILDRARRMG